jgi:hypothetical protein
MLRCVALVWTDVSEEPRASIIRVIRIRELGTLAITSNRHMQYFVFLSSVRRLLVTVNIPSSDSGHPDDGGAKFLWNVGSYKSHTA